MTDGGPKPVERSLLRDARRALAEDRAADALELLRAAVRARALSAEGVERTGAVVREALAAPGLARGRVLLLGQCTTQWLRNTIAAVALGEGLDLAVDEGGYDTVLQDVSALTTDNAAAAPTLVLLPWHARLLARDARGATERVEDEIRYWRDVWRIARERGVERIVQAGYDWIGPGALGYHLGGRAGAGGDVEMVRRANDALREALPATAYYVPLDEISGMQGRATFYDRRGQLWTRQPFSARGLVALAEQIVAGVRALTTGPRKVLVLDLDDTLWGGVVGEVGAAGVALAGTPDGDAFVAFQRHLKALSDRGILLAVSSKNEPADARAPFTGNADMVLALEDFAAFEATWEPKVESLRRIAATLRLGLDSFVFFDDNPAEREHVRQALPEVTVVDVPQDPAEYVRALEESLAFEAVALTAEDARRRELYATEGRRREAAGSAGSVESYLESLEMTGVLRPIDDTDLPRVVQLLGKTNQFNLTTRRHGADQVRAMVRAPGAVCFTLRMRDRFGDHGLVAVLLAVPEEWQGERALRVDTLLMSCRVIGRTAEWLILNHLVEEARRRGFATVLGELRRTPKNSVVHDLWVTAGFTAAPSAGDADVERFTLRVGDARPLATFVQPRDERA